MSIPTNSKISSDIQKLDPGSLLELYELDLTPRGGTKYYFHSDVNTLNSTVVWQTIEYTPFPLEASGFESTGVGSSPRPKLRLANILGLIGTLAITYNDMVGCKFTRRRTFVKYLDAINFPGGINTTADTNAHFPDDIYYVDRKSSENRVSVEFELASVLELNGIVLPRRQVVAHLCSWKYRSAECSYTGGAAADSYDSPCISAGGVVPNINDSCGKRLVSCEIRFGTGVLPYGGFPAVGLIR